MIAVQTLREAQVWAYCWADTGVWYEGDSE